MSMESQIKLKSTKNVSFYLMHSFVEQSFAYTPNPFLKQLFALNIPINLGTFNPFTLQFPTSEYRVSEAWTNSMWFSLHMNKYNPVAPPCHTSVHTFHRLV